MILTDKHVSREAFEAGSGWSLTPEGACKGDVCIPLEGAESEMAPEARIDVTEISEAMGLPLVHDEEHGVWALGPESIGSRALLSAEAADFELPDLEGNLLRLSSLRGQKILVYAWAPY
jgi:hypothetical protein